jgi:hypothetical protein
MNIKHLRRVFSEVPAGCLNMTENIFGLQGCKNGSRLKVHNRRVHRTYVFYITLKMVYQFNVIRIKIFSPGCSFLFSFSDKNDTDKYCI